MWKCPKCKEECEDTFDSCWSCGTGRGGSPPAKPSPEDESGVVSEASPISSSALSSRPERSSSSSPNFDTILVKRSVTQRYSDAYLVARAITGIGVLVKRMALVLGGGIILVALFAFASQGSKESTTYAAGGIIVAFVVAIPIYVLGILIAAQGEILKATLDTAVTNSPFLKKEEMAKVMSL